MPFRFGRHTLANPPISVGADLAYFNRLRPCRDIPTRRRSVSRFLELAFGAAHRVPSESISIEVCELDMVVASRKSAFTCHIAVHLFNRLLPVIVLGCNHFPGVGSDMLA